MVNKGVRFRYRRNRIGAKFDRVTEYCYENGITGLCWTELAGDDAADHACSIWEAERRGRDRRGSSRNIKVKISAAFCFSNQVNRIEYYHNSSWLEYGGSPDKAVRQRFRSYAIDAYLQIAEQV